MRLTKVDFYAMLFIVGWYCMLILIGESVGWWIVMFVAGWQVGSWAVKFGRWITRETYANKDARE